MKLVIVESPTKSTTIANYLGKDFVVLASKGHIRDLSTKGPGGLGIDVKSSFKPDWEISPAKARIVAMLREAAKKAEEVYLATDPDREGEAISWHLAEVLDLPISSTKRLQFHEITKPAITAAIQNPGLIDMNLVHAQEARRMEDRIIGFKVSGLLQRRIRVQSAGRVQSATLRMIVDRQRAIDAFVPEEYWTIEIDVVIGGKKLTAPLTRVDGKPLRCHSQEEAEALLARIPETLTVTSLAKKERLIQPKPAFTTSTLQQEAYAKFHFSNKQTQSIAQSLYEGMTINGEHVGMITYMRTDSTRISPEFFTRHAVPFVTETYGKEYLGSVRQGKGGKNVQDAHEAIRPTGTHRTPEVVANSLGATSPAAKLYRLIYCRAMASLMAPKKIEQTSVILSGNGLDFSLSGSRVLFPGYSVVFGEFDDSDETTLPEMQQGQEITVKKTRSEQKFTKPEPAYNQASIVKAMEENGIGRPSTYASTIETLKARKYVTVSRGVLTPTESGIRTVDALAQFFPDVVSTDYTATMERQLDRIESGEVTFLETMNEFYEAFIPTFERAKEEMQKLPAEETGEVCPECGKPLVYKQNRKGQSFIGCSGYPKCKYIYREKKEVELTGTNCPECGSPLAYKLSKRGDRFIGCTNYPSCAYSCNLNGTQKKARKKTASSVTFEEKDFLGPCPECDGHLVMRKSRGHDIIGCTNYPKCKYHQWPGKKTK